MVTGNTVSNNAFDRRNNIVLHVAEKAMQTGTKKRVVEKQVRFENQIKDLRMVEISC